MPSNELIIRMLRAQAWERAKGELNALRHTFCSEMDNNNLLYEAGKLDKFDALLAQFIKNVEDEELQY